MKIRVIMGCDVYGSYGVRMDFDGYVMDLMNGGKDTDSVPYYGVAFNEYNKDEIISALKTLLLHLMTEDKNNENDLGNNFP